MWFEPGYDIIRPYHNGEYVKEVECKQMRIGDSMEFQLDMVKKTCEIIHNKKSLGIVFKDLPNEIIPVCSNYDSDYSASIHFVDGVFRR